MIYDTFTFFNELELLELRLHELASVVDRFVLVEATRTHTNQPKPLYYQENQESFRPFCERIIHVVVNDMPDSTNPWDLENFQRNCIGRGLIGCQPDDLILVSDLDEIPRARTVQQMARTMKYRVGLGERMAHRIVKWIAMNRVLRREFRKFHPYVWKFEQERYGYFLNCQFVNAPTWYGTRLMYYRDFTLANELRHCGYHTVPNGGWHFSWMGGVERIRAKAAAFAHQEFNRPEYMAPERVAQCIKEGQSLCADGGQAQFFVVDERLPDYVRRHPERFANLIRSV